MKKIILGLLLVLMVAGCAGLPDLSNLFNGGGGNNINKTVLSPDLIVIQNINTIPSPPINAGDQFSVSFEIKNQDEVNVIKNVGYNLYDTGLCSLVSGDKIQDTIDSLAPKQTEFKEWNFNTPSNSEIGSLPSSCPIRFDVNYTFNATSQIDVDVISTDRLKQLQRSGNPPSFTPNLVIGSGPVKIEMSFGTSLPARDNSSLPVFITVEDVGTGLYREIKNYTTSQAMSLTLKVPSVFSLGDCGEFVADGTDGNYTLYRNVDTIPIIKKTSYQIRCSFITPTTNQVPDLIEKTYFITATLQYPYYVTGETSVGIKPITT